MDNLEDKESEQTDASIKQIIKLALNKIRSYYPTTDGNVYILATGKFDLVYMLISYLCYLNIIILIFFIFTLKY